MVACSLYLLDVSIHDASIIFFHSNPHTRFNMLFFRKTLYKSYFINYILLKSIGPLKTEPHFIIFLDKSNN